MTTFKFYIKDTSAGGKEVKNALEDAFNRLGGALSSPNEADLIAVHRNTDGSKTTEKKDKEFNLNIQESIKKECLYIEYTKSEGSTEWQRTQQTTKGYYGGYNVILKRLSTLKAPIKLKDIRTAFDLSFNYIIALSILTQGYLATHEKIAQPVELTNPEYAKEETEKQVWWHPDKKDFNELENKICKELKTIGKTSKDILLINIIKDNKLEDIVYFKNEALEQEKEGDFTKKVNDANKKLIDFISGNLD